MKSYISIESSYGSIVRCEVENRDVSEVRKDEIILDCYMADVERALFTDKGFYPVSGDIYSAVHDNGIVTEICDFEPIEKARRINLLMGLIEE